MKRLITFSLFVIVLLCLAGCKTSQTDEDTFSKSEAKMKIEEKQTNENGEKMNMKLYFNDIEIPVTWENNPTVNEIIDEVSDQDIVVQMSMYSHNEQVGNLGKSYIRNDKQMTAHNGDIMLYSGDKIVVFYGSNNWSYTKLAKINLSESEVTHLLSNGDIILKITK